MPLSEPQNTAHQIGITVLIQHKTLSGLGCAICPGPPGESHDIFKAGCFQREH